MSELAWHWTDGDKLRDGRPLPPIGETLVHEGPVEMCESGLHASRRVLDALQYAPGNTVHRVEVEGIVEEHDDKLVCRERAILWTVDAEEILRDFARRCASDVIELWDVPAIVREYLETGDESLRDAARDAARYAAGAAAWDAAGAAARNAARYAAGAAARAAVRAAAWYAAGDAAWYAARAAAGDAAWYAARAAAGAAAWDAVRAAAWYAAGDAAWASQNRRLTAMVSANRGGQG